MSIGKSLLANLIFVLPWASPAPAGAEANPASEYASMATVAAESLPTLSWLGIVILVVLVIIVAIVGIRIVQSGEPD
jgi:hypothetical protein